ncbi:hypothetical protein BVX94_00545, partial [bacterium B17]
RWRDTEIVLRTIVDSEDAVADETKRLHSFVERTRIEARAEVLQRSDKSIFDEIRDNSQDAALVFLGIRAPEEDETVDQYTRYYQNLLEQTGELPPAAFVMASENVDFYGIFREE